MWSVCALGWAMWRLLRGRGRVYLPRPRSSPSPWVGRGGDRRLKPGLSPSPGVGRSRVRRLLGLSPSPSPGSGGAEFAVFRGWARVRALGRAERSSPSSRAKPEPWVGRSGVSYGAWGRAWLPASLTLSSGTAVEATQAALSFCQAGQWSGEVTAVTSALSTGGRASG
jgi:hypothetical protein